MAELSDVVKRLDAITALLVLLARTIGAALIARPNKTVRRRWPGPLRNREDRGQTAASSQLGTRKDSREESQET